MFKKINQYLIENYPLAWNLKLVYILTIGLFTNLISFAVGFVHYTNQSQLLDYNLLNAFYVEYYVIYVFVFVLIILIIWLYFYIKNNRFKSKYPTSRNYLFKEFLGVFTVILLFSFVPSSFNFGLKTRIANLISDKQFAEDVDLINRVMPFTLQHENGYTNYSRNLSVPVFDTLVTHQQVLGLYTSNKKEYLKNNPTRTSYTEFIEPYFRNEEFNDLLYQKLKASYIAGDSFSTNYQDYNDSIADRYFTTNRAVDVATGIYEPDAATEETIVDTINTIPTIYSIYNYSNIVFSVPNRPDYTHQYYDKELINLLQINDKQKVDSLLTAVNNKLDEYKIGYRFKDNTWLDYVYNPPYYFISKELTNKTKYDGVNDIAKDYININALIDIYKNYQEAKYTYNSFEHIELFILVALTISICICLFRFTSFKVWLIALVGLGIISIFGVCIGVSLNFLSINFYNRYLISIFFYLLFVALSIKGLVTNKHKILTGVSLNWLIYSSIFIVLLVLSFYKEVRYDMIYNELIIQQPDLMYYDVKTPELDLLDKIQQYYFYFNPILVILFLYLSINWLRKWQAMAEE